jgi:hypothetical protein
MREERMVERWLTARCPSVKFVGSNLGAGNLNWSGRIIIISAIMEFFGTHLFVGMLLICR